MFKLHEVDAEHEVLIRVMVKPVSGFPALANKPTVLEQSAPLLLVFLVFLLLFTLLSLLI